MEIELLRRSRELQEVNEALRAASTAKSEFLSQMSHELRSPLTAIMGFGELLRYSELDEKQQQRVSLILKAGQHLGLIVNEVLDLSRIEAGDISISAEPVPVQPLIEDALDLMRPLADANGIVVACGEAALRLTELQKPGGKRLPVAEFLKGFSVEGLAFE